MGIQQGDSYVLKSQGQMVPFMPTPVKRFSSYWFSGLQDNIGRLDESTVFLFHLHISEGVVV